MDIDFVTYLSKGRSFNSSRPFKEEDKLAYEFRQWLTDETLSGRLNCVWFHVANEVSDGKKYVFGSKLRSLGKLPGVADYIFLKGDGCGALELKGLKGRISDSQLIFRKWCERHDVRYSVARTLDEAKDFVRNL